ncbi:phage tail terminator protein [Bacillus sp. OTU530]|uniref:phage tail terminator protein n=1 Tax=Bacillus sp. OTU530 TaxID=3043862 RepID=UPI00313C5624
MDFYDRMMDYIESHLTLYASLQMGVLSPKTNGIAILSIPSSPNAKYLDGGSVQNISFRIYTKHTDQKIAANTIQIISDLLDKMQNDDIQSQDGSFIFISCEVNTIPSSFDKTDHDEYIYSALFVAEIERG